MRHSLSSNLAALLISFGALATSQSAVSGPSAVPSVVPTVENTFIECVIENQLPVSIFLINGIKLQGYIVKDDSNVLVLSSGVASQMVYKHGVSTIVPSQAICDM